MVTGQPEGRTEDVGLKVTPEEKRSIDGLAALWSVPRSEVLRRCTPAEAVEKWSAVRRRHAGDAA